MKTSAEMDTQELGNLNPFLVILQDIGAGGSTKKTELYIKQMMKMPIFLHANTIIAENDIQLTKNQQK